MNINTISVIVNQVNGQVADILKNVTPATALERYFYPDPGAPVLSLIINAKTSDGNTLTLAITQTEISASIED